MGFLPRTMGTRPRLACEVRAEGVVAARTDSNAADPAAALSAVERVTFANGAARGMSNGSISRAEKVAALRRALDAVGQRGREVTLVVPDTAARVLLVDFDELPAKASEALPVVRFRLKKLLPFDADDAAVSYQVMAQTRSVTQVLAVAMPRELLAEYESMVREAGYEPGAVLPSTLAVLAGLEEDAAPALVVNAGRDSVTTAIVKDGLLLLHRTIDLTAGDLTAGDLGAGGAVTAAVGIAGAGEMAKGAVVAGVSAAPFQAPGNERDEISREASQDMTIAAIAARFAAMEGQTTPAPRAPDGPHVSRVGSALASAASAQGGAGAASATDSQTASLPAASGRAGIEQDEIAQAVSVAAAYFEDTLEMAPPAILSAGTLGADALARLLSGAGASRVQEMAGGGETGGVPAGWLAGVRGALRS